MQKNELQWSEQDKQLTHEALQKAYTRETEALIQEITQKATQITDINDVWSLHDYLSTKRYDIDGKYDDRDSTPIFALAQLIKQGWLSIDELADLSSDKRSKIAALTRI